MMGYIESIKRVFFALALLDEKYNEAGLTLLKSIKFIPD